MTLDTGKQEEEKRLSEAQNFMYGFLVGFVAGVIIGVAVIVSFFCWVA